MNVIVVQKIKKLERSLTVNNSKNIIYTPKLTFFKYNYIKKKQNIFEKPYFNTHKS